MEQVACEESQKAFKFAEAVKAQEGMNVLLEKPHRDITSLVKSALQKAIRRGRKDQARKIIAWCMRRSLGAMWIAKRLIVIAAEDVGSWELLGRAVMLSRLAIAEDKRKHPPAAAAVLMMISDELCDEDLKTRFYDDAWCWAFNEEYYKMNGMKELMARPDLPSMTVKVFANQDIELDVAMRFSYALLTVAKRKKDEDRFWDIMMRVGMQRGADGVGLVALARDAASFGGLNTPIHAMLVHDLHEMDLVPEFRTPFVEEWKASTEGDLEVPWFSADHHTKLGRVMLSKLAKEFGEKTYVLGDMVFYEEGAVLHPPEEENEYLDRLKRLWSKLWWGVNQPKRWEKMRPRIREAAYAMIGEIEGLVAGE